MERGSKEDNELRWQEKTFEVDFTDGTTEFVLAPQEGLLLDHGSLDRRYRERSSLNLAGTYDLFMRNELGMYWQ
jgi:hypothetical protein